jgi:membrane associated rhomboid family serine protease
MVGVAATLAHAGFNVGSGVPTVGASGAIAGVLGAYLWLYPRSTVVLMIPIFFWPFFFQVPAFLFLGIWFLEQLFFGAASTLAPITTESGGVAWWAHAGGFLAGFVAILPLARGRDEPDPLERTNLFPDERERRY